MAIEVKMPQLGESVFEGTVGKWLKQVGDHVEKYQPLLEVITDKVDTEITAAESGTLLSILVPEGETVTVGAVLATLGAAGEVPAGKPETAATGKSDTAATAAAGTTTSAAAATTAAPLTAAMAATAPVATPITSTAIAARVSPVAARMAAEHGIDPAQVPGTGRGGQVTREDVERFVAGTQATSPGPNGQSGVSTGASGAPGAATAGGGASNGIAGFISPRVGRLAAQHGVNLAEVRGSGRDGRVTAQDVERYVTDRASVPAVPTTAMPSSPAAGAPAGTAAPKATSPILGELLELSPMRKAIAEHMVRSKHTSPHVTTVHEVDMSAVFAAYAKLKESYAERGIKLTYTAFILHAAAQALAQHPLVNSSWTEAGVQIHRDINIGVAVAVAQGLIVPVIKHADEKNLMGLARDVNDLSSRAREKKLVPDDVQGGTFTLTNYGTLGSILGTPVINQPQAAILGSGAIKKRVVVVEGPAGDSIAIRPMMLLALTFDHRILDGGTADPFMQTMVRLLEGYEA